MPVLGGREVVTAVGTWRQEVEKNGGSGFPLQPPPPQFPFWGCGRELHSGEPYAEP